MHQVVSNLINLNGKSLEELQVEDREDALEAERLIEDALASVCLESTDPGDYFAHSTDMGGGLYDVSIPCDDLAINVLIDLNEDGKVYVHELNIEGGDFALVLVNKESLRRLFGQTVVRYSIPTHAHIFKEILVYNEKKKGYDVLLASARLLWRENN
jgi:hypothetical protein